MRGRERESAANATTRFTSTFWNVYAGSNI